MVMLLMRRASVCLVACMKSAVRSTCSWQSCSGPGLAQAFCDRDGNQLGGTGHGQDTVARQLMLDAQMRGFFRFSGFSHRCSTVFRLLTFIHCLLAPGPYQMCMSHLLTLLFCVRLHHWRQVTR